MMYIGNQRYKSPDKSLIVPDSYDAELEYLESNGTLYIDTGIKLYRTSPLNFQIDIKFIGYQGTDTSTFHWGNFINSMQETNSYPGDVLRSKTDLGTTFVQWTGGTGNNFFDLNKGPVGQLLTLSLVRNGSYTTHNINTTIFAGYNGNGVPWRYANMKLYYCIITNLGLVVRHYIPVRVGQVGYLYDKVSGRLFSNKGTGEFILGPDINT